MMRISNAEIARFAMIGLKVMTERLLTWATMLLTACAFGYVIYQPDITRLASATIFALLVFWRVTWVEKIHQQPAKGEINEES